MAVDADTEKAFSIDYLMEKKERLLILKMHQTRIASFAFAFHFIRRRIFVHPLSSCNNAAFKKIKKQIKSYNGRSRLRC